MSSPQANPHVHAMVAANFGASRRQASTEAIKQRLREQTEFIRAREVGQEMLYANEHGHQVFDILSGLKEALSANTKALEESKSERDAFEERSNAFEERFNAFEEKSRAERDAFEVKIGEHEAKIRGHEEKIEELTMSNHGHEAKIRDLTHGSAGYKQIRERFLLTYQRDYGTIKPAERSSKIAEGNRRAHAGDAAMDAIVYRDDNSGEFHEQLFRDLYYIDYRKVLELDAAVIDGKVDERVFSILNARGTVIAEGKEYPEHLENAFKSYVDEVYGESDAVTALAKKFWRLHFEFRKSR